VDGIITMPSPSDVPALASVIESGIPVVGVDLWQPGLNADFVCLDNSGAGRLAGQHLVDHGHESIGVIVGDLSISTMRERYEGFAGALPATPPSEWILTGSMTSEWGREAMNRMLSQRPRPSAVFAANYDLTLGAVIAINESGLRLGQDISLIGFDSLELARVTRPTLTIVTQPVEELAREAGRIMHQRLEGDRSAHTEPTMTRLAGSLVVGGSVSALRA